MQSNQQKPKSQAVRTEEADFRSLFEQYPDPIFFVNAEGRFVLANLACAEVSGYPTSELFQKNFMDLCAPERTPQRLETALIRKDSQRVELLVTGNLVSLGNEITALHCTAKDITERKRAEEALLQSNGRLGAILDHKHQLV